MHAFDRQTNRQTDRQTEFPSLYRDCIPCSAVKIELTVMSEKRSSVFGGKKMGVLGKGPTFF